MVPSKDQASSLDLTARDLALLRDVWLYRYVTSAHVARLHFGNRRLAQRRLRRLFRHGLLDRFQGDGGVGVGLRTWWYRLSHIGARVVAADASKPVADVRPPQRSPSSIRFLAHHGLVTDFRLWLREGCEAAEFGYEFVPAYEEVRREGRRGRRIALAVPGHTRLAVPDGAFAVRKGHASALFLLEVDRGTEPLTGRHASAIEHKFTRYRDAFDSGAAEAQFGGLFGAAFNGFRVLCVVPSGSRAEGFLRVAETTDLVPLVWVATHDVLASQGDLAEMCWATEPDGPLRRLTE